MSRLAYSLRQPTEMLLELSEPGLKGGHKKTSPPKIWPSSGGRTVWPRRLSFSPFVVLMSTTNGEKDSLLGQTVLPPELGQILGGLVFLWPPFRPGSDNSKSISVGCRREYASLDIDIYRLFWKFSKGNFFVVGFIQKYMLTLYVINQALTQIRISRTL